MSKEEFKEKQKQKFEYEIQNFKSKKHLIKTFTFEEIDKKITLEDLHEKT